MHKLLVAIGVIVVAAAIYIWMPGKVYDPNGETPASQQVFTQNAAEDDDLAEDYDSQQESLTECQQHFQSLEALGQVPGLDWYSDYRRYAYFGTINKTYHGSHAQEKEIVGYYKSKGLWDVEVPEYEGQGEDELVEVTGDDEPYEEEGSEEDTGGTEDGDVTVSIERCDHGIIRVNISKDVEGNPCGFVIDHAKFPARVFAGVELNETLGVEGLQMRDEEMGLLGETLFANGNQKAEWTFATTLMGAPGYLIPDNYNEQAVLDYYAERLPNLGWKQMDARSYESEDGTRRFVIGDTRIFDTVEEQQAHSIAVDASLLVSPNKSLQEDVLSCEELDEIEEEIGALDD